VHLMENKIFTDIPEDVTEDWLHGAIIGGMCGYDNESLAESYFLSADLLIKKVLQAAEPAREYLYPILFLYRHGLELYLKAITKPEKLNHSIGSLFELFCTYILKEHNQKVPAWVTKPISQFAEFDPESDLFRYQKTKNPKRSERLANEGEFWVDLPLLMEQMANLDVVFRKVLAAQKYGINNSRTVFKRLGKSQA